MTEQPPIRTDAEVKADPREGDVFRKRKKERRVTHRYTDFNGYCHCPFVEYTEGGAERNAYLWDFVEWCGAAKVIHA